MMHENKSIQIPKISRETHDCFCDPIRPSYMCPWDCPAVPCKSFLLKRGDINPLLFSSRDKLQKTNKRMPNTFPHVKLDALLPNSNPFKA